MGLLGIWRGRGWEGDLRCRVVWCWARVLEVSCTSDIV